MITESHDWGAGEIITYRLLGKCNGCGDCCKVRVNLGDIVQRYDDHDGRPATTEGLPTIANEGIWGTRAAERKFFMFEVTEKEDVCPAFGPTPDGNEGCTVYDKRPNCCSVFPLVPSDIAKLPNCSYSFEEIGRRVIDTSPDGPDDYSMPEIMKRSGDS